MIEYRTGNVLDCPERPVTFTHIVNDVGYFGRGFSGDLARRFPWAERSFRAWSEGGMGPPYALGEILYHQVYEEGVTVLHLCAQHGVGRGQRRVDYQALDRCLQKVVALDSIWRDQLGTLAMPRIGTGLGGGEWEDVEGVIERRLTDFPVKVYTLEGA